MPLSEADRLPVPDVRHDTIDDRARACEPLTIDSVQPDGTGVCRSARAVVGECRVRDRDRPSHTVDAVGAPSAHVSCRGRYRDAVCIRRAQDLVPVEVIAFRI